MTTAPCKDCVDRHPGCHSVCGRYAEYSRERDEEREAKKKCYDYESARAWQTEKVRSSMWRKYGRRK